MASEAPKKAPGKLKFNAAMFNTVAKNQKVGAKNPLDQKRKAAPSGPLKPPDDQFERPTAPRRRGRSKHKLQLDEETKEDALESEKFYAQSFVSATDENSDIKEADAPTSNPTDDTNTDNTQNTQQDAPNPSDDTNDNDTNTDIHNKLDSELQSRGDPTAIGILDPNKVSPAIQQTVKQLEHQKKADDINKQLSARQDIETMVDQGLISSDPRKVHGSLHETQSSVSQQLSDRATKDFLLKTKILKHPKIDASIQPQADDLEKRLVTRSPATPSMIDDSVAPALAAASKALDRNLTSDKVSKALKDENRSSLQTLEEQGVITDSKIAPALAAASKKLDKKLTSDRVSQKLGSNDRQTYEELADKGVIQYPNLSNNLVANAKKLEKSQITDQVSKGLRDRQTVDDLAQSNILTSHQMAPSMHGAANELERSMQKDQVHKGLRDRQTVDELAQSNILTSHPDKVAPSMHGAANELQKSMQKDQLHKGLRDRQTVDELAQSNILTSNPDKVAPSMHGTASDLQKSMQKDQLHKGLRDRQTVDELAQSNILTSNPDKVAPSMHGAANDLQKSMQKDQLAKGLRERQTVEELAQSNILTSHPDQVAPSMHGTANELQKSMQKDQLTQGLRDRQTADDLAQSNILTSNPDKVAPSMHGTASDLQKSMQKDQVHKGLRDRQTVDSLTDSNILASDPAQIAPAIHATQKDLQKNIQKDQVKKGLRDRQTIDALTQSNILTSNPEQVAPSIHAAQNELQKQLAKDSLKQGLQNRPTTDELTQSNVLTSNPEQIAPAIQDAKNQLQKSIHKDQLQQGLRDRATVDDLTQTNVLTSNPEHIAPSIHAPARDLEKQIQKDQLKQGLRSREDIEALHNKNIITPNVAPQIAAQQRELEQARKADILQEKLIDPERPDNEDLVDAGILYSSTMSPAIQSNAKDLESKIRETQHNQDIETTSSPSNEQSPTATDTELEQAEYERITKRGTFNDDIQRTSKSRKLTADFLEEFLENRFDYDEIAERGIIQDVINEVPTNYILTQDNNQPAANLTKKEIRRNRKRVSTLLDKRFALRKKPEELEERGVLPKDYFDDPQGAYEMRQIQRKLAKEDLKRNLKGRTPADEIVQRGIAPNDFLQKSPNEIRRERRKEIKQHKKQLNEKLHRDRRPSVHDLVAKQIIPEDSDVIQELKNIAHSHKRMESAVKDLSSRLPFEDDTNVSVAKTMMRHVNDTNEDVELEDCDTDDLFSDDEEQNKTRQTDDEDSEQDPDIDYNQSSDIEDNDEAGELRFDLEAVQKKNKKRRLSQSIEHFLKHKPNMQELEDRGLLKQTGIANSLRGNAVALEERMNNMPTHRELVKRNIIKRPSMSRSLQPNAEALEEALILNLAKLSAKELGLEPAGNNHPLFKQKQNVKRGRGGHQRKNSGFGTKKGQNPTFYKHDIAPQLQSTANKLHMRRLSQTIENRLNARPTKQELVDQRILYKESMAHQLQGNAMRLEKQLQQRVPEKYLQKIGVLMHNQESVAPKLQGASYELEYALRRRPSLFDGANQDIVKILGIPDEHHEDPNAFYTNELFKLVPRSSNQSTDNEEPLNISAFEEMYPDDNDKTNYRLRRARNSDKLEKRMSRRMSQTDLIKANVIPQNYFVDPHEAVEMRQIQRKLAAEDLKRGLKNRSTVDELVQRGLTRYEYFNMDMDKARKEIAKHSQNTKKQVELQLNSIFNPQLIELEKRGIVEEGYFMTRANQIAEGHRRLPSVTAELQQKLLNNPGYNEELAKTLVSDLHSDSDSDEDGEYITDDSDEVSSEDMGTDSDSDEMDSDDEEQARRLQELEYKIGHRPSTDELVDKNILYKKPQDMASSLQNAAKKLQGVIAKRPSLLQVAERGILLAATNQDQLDTSSVLTKKKKKKGKKKKKKIRQNVHAKENAHLNRKIGRRRPTMTDLEMRGIVPKGYFDDVESAMKETKIRKENIIHDLTSRLQSRPEFSESLASKLMGKAMDSLAKKKEVVASGGSTQDKKVIQGIINAKLEQRMGVKEMKDKNILSQNWSPEKSTLLNANADALEKEYLRQRLKEQLGGRQTEEDLVDAGYLKYRGHGNHGLSATYQPVAAQLESLVATRPDENFMKNKGYIYPERKELEKNIKKRPSISRLEQQGIIPHGAYHDLEAAKKAKHDRVESIHDELNAFFGADRRTKEELIEQGVFTMPGKRRRSVEIKAEAEDDDEDESIYNSPDIPPVPERGNSMFQTNTYTEIVMNSITFHNKKAVEPSYSIDLLVPEPDLTTQVIQTSTLSFLNVLDNLDTMIVKKIDYAKDKYITQMQAKSTDLQSLKNLLRSLEQYGLAIVEEEFDGIEQFESCGDIDQDIDNVWKEITKRQQELYAMDEEYIALHVKIKELQTVKNDLSEYCDKYKIQLSQLKRVKQRISSYIQENKMTKDSSHEAMKATDSNQAWMISKITNKIVKLQAKIDNLAADSDELITCTNFLNGLKEFLKGLKKLRKSSNDTIQHLECIVEQLQEQEKDIVRNIEDIRRKAVEKLNEIRAKYVKISDDLQDDIKQESKAESKYNEDNEDSGISDLSENDGEDESDIEIVDFSQSAPLSMLELMHKREKYMTKVYKKIHDLESRAQTTSSTDYLRGLTEIRELQIILNNPSLKYFYNHFVSSCNEVFNDCCLASQAILENTAEINSQLLTNLKGVQMLNDVLERNKRKLNEDDTMQHLDSIVLFVQSLPDREVVIMQIARHLSLSLPFRSFIVGEDELKKEREKRKRLQQMNSNTNNEYDEDKEEESEHHLIKIDKFITNKIREWMGSILNIYGNNAFSSVRVALDDDVVAQVRPSYAARLIVNCVYGLDVSL